MKNTFLNLLVGGAGVGAIEVVEKTVAIDPNVVNETVGLIAQLVIILASIIGIFKRKKT